MNKRLWLITPIVIIVLIAPLLIAMLLETFRPIISADEFISRMENAGYTVEEQAHLFEQVDIYLVADCGAFYVEFIGHDSIADARYTFSKLRSELEQLEQNLDTVYYYAWRSSGFSSWYSQRTSDGQYARMIRIRSTIIFVSTAYEHYVDVADVLERLGQ